MRLGWLTIVVLLAAATFAPGCDGEGSIAVTVHMGAQASTDCVIVSAWSVAGRAQDTDPIPRQGRAALTVALFPGGELGESVFVSAQGYEGDGCQTLTEQTAPKNARFIRGKRETVELELHGTQCWMVDAGTPCPAGVCRSDGVCVDAGTEIDCTNGTDDDGDSLSDCRDGDCLGVTCPVPACRRMGVCRADGGCEGTPVVCDTPPGLCFQSMGTCSTATDQCQYQGDTTRGCDDGDDCTDPDQCQADGGCGGRRMTCNMPPGQCFGNPGNCVTGLGCQYVPVTGSCNDGNPCTTGDSCLPDGGCRGSMPTCFSNDPCQTALCQSDGGCRFTFEWGAACDAGLSCSPRGLCTGFPYDPSNFDPLAVAAQGIAPPVVIDCPARYDTTGTGGSTQWCGRTPPTMVVVQQDGGPPAGLIATYGLMVTGTNTLEIVGSRPAIVAVFGDVLVSGTITVRALRGSTTGAGANPGAPYCAAAGNAAPSSYAGGGGGGGGFGTAGGEGGDATGTGATTGALGGAASGNSQLIPLRGGCPGGMGGAVAAVPGSGGSGGGALQISAARRLELTGSITASGAGGDGGQDDRAGQSSGGGNGGGGGGSGGAILLQGTVVGAAAGARLTANGGAGGEGGSWTMDTFYQGDPGDNGSTLTNASVSGGDGPSCGGSGGDGGSRTGVGQNGRDSTNTGGCGGGGAGGAVGRIRIYAHLQCTVDAGVLSPSPSYAGQCP